MKIYYTVGNKHSIISLNICLPFSIQLISEPPMFKAAAVRGSNEEDYFKNHINSTFRRIHEVNLRENSVSSLETGVEQMRQG